MKPVSRAIKVQKTLRPTASRVREALFDILRGRIDNARFLDLYAGTGAVGLDALNEGAEEVLFVEESRVFCRHINESIQKSHSPEKCKVINRKVLSFIEWAELNRLVFDIIFLDPPYHIEEIADALSAIDKSGILKQSGTVIAEHFTKKQLPEKFNILYKIKDYTYGDTVLSFYRNKECIV